MSVELTVERGVHRAIHPDHLHTKVSNSCNPFADLEQHIHNFNESYMLIIY